MNRPAGMAERRSAEEARRVAAVRAALAARRADQAAAARRRLWFTLALLVATAVAWVAFAVADFSVFLALVPTAVLAVVIWLGIRAGKADRAEWARVPESLRAPRSEPSDGPTYSASQLREHLSASAAAEGSTGEGGLRWSTDASRSAAAGSAAGSASASGSSAASASAHAQKAERPAPGTWTPIPVPVPTYTLKATAVRREPAPAEATQELPAFEEGQTAEAEQPGIDLNAVLARRRAIGA